VGRRIGAEYVFFVRKKVFGTQFPRTGIWEVGTETMQDDSAVSILYTPRTAAERDLACPEEAENQNRLNMERMMQRNDLRCDRGGLSQSAYHLPLYGSTVK